MPKKENFSTRESDPEQVDAYMRALRHPLKNVAEQLRRIILGADQAIGEEIKWNAPAFFYTGPMAPLDSKQHKRHVAVFNLFRKDCIRLVFPTGAVIGDRSGLLAGDYADGRRLAFFASMKDVLMKQDDLQRAIQIWLKSLSAKP
jgi:hypothetical protein